MKEHISVNCQSSIKINGEKIIYFDPYQITEELHDADLIFITHDHYDHYDVNSIRNIMSSKTKIIIPDQMAPIALRDFKSDSIIGVIPDTEYEIEKIKLETIKSYNTNKQFHPKANNWVGYIITLENERIYVAGDTDITEDNKKVKCDIALVPIGGTYTMTSKEAAELVNTIKPKTVIPTHYITIVGTKEDEKIFQSLLNKEIECLIKIEE